MRKAMFRLVAGMPALVFYLGLAACSGENQTNAEREGEPVQPSEEAAEPAMSEGGGEHREGGELAESDEHGGLGEGDEHVSEGEGEESGVYIGSGDTWDATRNGIRLVLSFDPATNAFVGSVENRTPVRLCAVRVEVHLSTDAELGPTERTDLDPNETREVRLPTSGETFDAWTAHPELSPCEGL